MPELATVQNTLRRFLPRYRHHHRLSAAQAKVCRQLSQCRTQALGGESVACEHCGFEQQRYHSCRNRHCPQCQRGATEQWTERQCEHLLPVPYFHLVFTLPHALNSWVERHPEVIYRLLFASVWGTLKAFGQDPKRLDGQLGMSAVLHTWGQNLSRHVHLHCLVPGGAWSTKTGCWHPCKSHYLFPVKALSRRFRGNMVVALRRAHEKGELPAIDIAERKKMLDDLMATPWVVYTRSQLHRSETIVQYLARYTHRIAISDARLIQVDEQQVRFRWKDYRDNNKEKIMTLDGEEFLRRFLLHILPQGFMRVRHFGFLANRCRRKTLSRIRQSLATPVTPKEQGASTTVSQTYRCPRCRQGHLRVKSNFPTQTPERRPRTRNA